MNGSFPISTAAKIAWRETRASWTKFAFVVLAVAAGVGCLSGVRGFSESFRTMLLKEARVLMAGDISARMFQMPAPEQIAVLDELRAKGVERTQITETVSMAQGDPERPPLLVSIKAIDPARYPYYGSVKLSPPGDIRQVLTSDTVAVAEDLLVRLNRKLGESVHIGGSDYRIAAVVQAEPDRMSGSLNIGLRLMMTREAFERTGLVRPGSRAAQRFLFKLSPQSPPVEQVRDRLKKTFPEAQVIDFRQTHPIITRGLDRSTMFLSLVSLIALIVGAIGVGMAMHAHLQQKMDNIAVMKSIGGRSGQIMKIYLLQTLLLGLLGGVLGVMVGLGVQVAFPGLIEKYFQMRPEFRWSNLAALQGIVAGMLTTLLFTLPPLLSIRRVRPAIILRRDTAEVKMSWRERLLENRPAIVAGALILLGIGGIAAWVGASARIGGYFVGGLVSSLLSLSLVAWLLMRFLKGWLRNAPRSLPSWLRQGMANLYRQGNHAQPVLVALGLGVMFTLTIYLVQDSLLRDLMRTAPPGMPNVFLIDVTQAQADSVREFLKSQPGLEGAPELIPSVAAKLIKVNGTPVNQLDLKGWNRRFLQTRSVMFERALPEQTTVLEGKWWDPSTTEPVVSIAHEASKDLGVHPGAKLEFLSNGRTIQATVRAVHRTDAIRVSAANEFVFNPEPLRDLPAMYYGGVRMKPDAVGALQRASYEKFPTVTVINIADALSMVQEVVDQIAVVIRFLSAFAILAGAVILAASVAGTRFRRIREVVILKTIGARRKQIARIFSVEFLALGAVAGLLGSLLAIAFSNVLMKRLLEAELHFDVVALLISVAATALLANAAGWLASFRILGQKPLEVLREE